MRSAFFLRVFIKIHFVGRAYKHLTMLKKQEQATYKKSLQFLLCSCFWILAVVSGDAAVSKKSLNAPEAKEIPDPISVIRISETLDSNPRLAQKVLSAANQKMQAAYKAVVAKDHAKYLATLGADLKKRHEPKEVFEALLKEREDLKDEKESADESVEPQIKEVARDEKNSTVAIRVIFQYIMLNPKDANKANLYVVVTETRINVPHNPSSSEIEKALIDGGNFEIIEWARQALVKDANPGSDKSVDEGPFIN